MDLSLKIEHLQSLLGESHKPSLVTPLRPQTGVQKLDEHFASLNLRNCVMEWGAPEGRLGRILPALFLKQMNHACLWISDHKEGQFYSKFYESLGLRAEKLFFIHTQEALKTLRLALLENAFKTVVFDSTAFISKAEQNFLSVKARENQATYFVLRPFFLSHRNGNPFCKYRINSSFNLRTNRFNINCIKGLPNKKSLSLHKTEIIND